VPVLVFEDSSNTLTGGNLNTTIGPSNESGQLPGTTSRRDSHGTEATSNGNYLHVVNRIQNIVDAFNVNSLQRITYDLTTKNGRHAVEVLEHATIARSRTVKIFL
jgi:hypothetical protein